MKRIRHLFLCIAFVAFILEIYDFISQDFSFGFKATFIIVSLQIIGLLIWTYFQSEYVANRKKFIDGIQIVVFCIYIYNLVYELFLNPAIRQTQLGEPSINLIPFKTVKLFIDSYQASSLPLGSIIINLMGNAILFIPLGYFIYVFFKSCRHFLFYSLVLLIVITSVELVQVYFNIGTGDIDDVILNMLGVIIFYVIFKIPLIRPFIERMYFK